VEWKSELQVLQEAVRKRDLPKLNPNPNPNPNPNWRKRDLRISENEAEAENRKAELMQVVARSKAAQNDLKAFQELFETIP